MCLKVYRVQKADINPFFNMKANLLVFLFPEDGVNAVCRVEENLQQHILALSLIILNAGLKDVTDRAGFIPLHQSCLAALRTIVIA